MRTHHVVSDITGVTGMKIIRAIVSGVRDPDLLASMRDARCHSSAQTIRASLIGNERDEHVFALSQSLELYDFYQQKMLDCDRRLESAIGAMSAEVEAPLLPLPNVRTKTKQVNAPSFDVRAALYGLVGTDLTQIHGLGSSLALKLIGECGTDLRAWPTAKHFTSWLCLDITYIRTNEGFAYLAVVMISIPAVSSAGRCRAVRQRMSCCRRC